LGWRFKKQLAVGIREKDRGLEHLCHFLHLVSCRTGLRDLALPESALAQPEASFAGEWLHGDHYEMAAAYAYHLCQNHPFIDGNKRTALAAALVFLELNGITILDPRGRLKNVAGLLAENRERVCQN
jgi:death-on-curing family protein